MKWIQVSWGPSPSDPTDFMPILVDTEWPGLKPIPIATVGWKGMLTRLAIWWLREYLWTIFNPLHTQQAAAQADKETRIRQLQTDGKWPL